MQPHPHLPVLAISGIDPTVKLFGPTNDVAKRANLIQEADTIIERNKARAGQDSDGDTLTVSAPAGLLDFLLRSADRFAHARSLARSLARRLKTSSRCCIHECLLMLVVVYAWRSQTGTTVMEMEMAMTMTFRSAL